MKKVKAYLKLMRIKHYIKNLIVLFPLFFSEQLLTAPIERQNALLGFLAMCMAASAIYVINDLHDIEKDRNHPTKCRRPLASGEVSPSEAYVLLAVLLVLCVFFSVLIGNLAGALILVLYLFLNLCYSNGLKNQPVIDVVILVSGYVLRLLYGALITQIKVSDWLFLTVMCGSFFLGFGKRRNEFQIQRGDETSRPVLKRYSLNFLDKNMYCFMTLTDMFYSLWVIEKENNLLFWSIPLFFLILMIYSFDVEGNADGDPVEVILGDRKILLLAVIYAVLVICGVYF
ncbi:MAG: decaprenyl-phosphate phosphoribosyltransferase [Bulleidia sp.]